MTLKKAVLQEALEYIYETTPYCKRRLAGQADTCRAWAMEDLEHCPRCVAEKALGKPVPPRMTSRVKR